MLIKLKLQGLIKPLEKKIDIETAIICVLSLLIGGSAYIIGVPFFKFPMGFFLKQFLDFLWSLFVAACLGFMGMAGKHLYDKKARKIVDRWFKKRKGYSKFKFTIKCQFMNKNSPLIAAIVGALAMVLEQAIAAKNWDVKVVGFTALIAVLGAVSTTLKGYGASFLGIIGTVGFTLYNLLSTSVFTWNEFILTSAFAVVSVIAPSFMPKKVEKKDDH